AAHDRAERVDADADVVLPGRLALVHRVEGRDAEDLRLGQAELLGAELGPVVGDVAVLRLDEVEQGQQRRPRLRVARDDLLRLAFEAVAALRCVCHRSTPPLTGSIEAIAETTSATMPPAHTAGSACRLVNEGSRKCTR